MAARDALARYKAFKAQQEEALAPVRFAEAKAETDALNRAALLNAPASVIATLPRPQQEKIRGIQDTATTAERLQAQNATIGMPTGTYKPLQPTLTEKVSRAFTGQQNDITRAKLRYEEYRIKKQQDEAVAKADVSKKPSTLGALATGVLSTLKPTGGELSPGAIRLEARRRELARTNPTALGVGELGGALIPVVGSAAEASRYIDAGTKEEDPYKIAAGLAFIALAEIPLSSFVLKGATKVLPKATKITQKLTPQAVKKLQTEGVKVLTSKVPNLTPSQASKVIGDTIVRLGKGAVEGAATGAPVGAGIGATQYVGQEGRESTASGIFGAAKQGATGGILLGGALGTLGAGARRGTTEGTVRERIAKRAEEIKAEVQPKPEPPKLTNQELGNIYTKAAKSGDKTEVTRLVNEAIGYTDKKIIDDVIKAKTVNEVRAIIEPVRKTPLPVYKTEIPETATQKVIESTDRGVQVKEVARALDTLNEGFRGPLIDEAVRITGKKDVLSAFSMVANNPKLKAKAPVISEVIDDVIEPIIQRIKGDEPQKIDIPTVKPPKVKSIDEIAQKVDTQAKATQEKVVESKPVKADKPVGKTSGVAKKISQEAIDKGVAKSMSELAEFTPTTVKEQFDRSIRLVNDDIEKTKRIIRGEELLPNDMNAGTFIETVKEYAYRNDDSDIIFDLANSPLVSATSRYAQEMRMLAEISPHNPVRAITEIKSELQRRSKRRSLSKLTPEEMKKKTTDEIRETQKKELSKVSKKEIDSFINNIIC